MWFGGSFWRRFLIFFVVFEVERMWGGGCSYYVEERKLREVERRGFRNII